LTEREEILAAWARVYDSGRFVLGSELEAFETELAEYVGTEFAIGVSSGSDALVMALRAMGINRPEQEVLVPALTFIATAEAVVRAGATPVFTDVDPSTWTMTTDTATPLVTTRTAALLPVDLFGNPAPIDRLAMFGVPILEDACQAIGSTYFGKQCGSLGATGCFSFYPSKTLAGVGDGGAVVTDDAELAERVKLLRHHGSTDGRVHQVVGYTGRLDELQAAALRIRLRRLGPRIAAQQARGMGDQVATEGGVSACHQTVRLGDGPGRQLYGVPCHLQPSMRAYYRGPLHVAEEFARSNHAQPPIAEPAGAPSPEATAT
jgi:dTDP-3-amino-3,4,6-trideoxy-alpha-D-glucose transaminase